MEPEHHLLVDLLRAFTGSGAVSPPRNGSVRWDRFAGLVRGHRLLQTLQPLLARSGAPPELIESLAEESRVLRLRTARLLLELDQILPTIESTGAHPLVLKGAALSHTTYDACGRFFADLDILVDEDRLQAVYDALRGEGYEFASTYRHPEYYERYHFHRVLTKQQIVVEIHWDLTGPEAFYSWNLDGLRSRSREVGSNGMAYRVPSEADQLLHAASQALREGFIDLRRVVDAALVLRSGTVSEAMLIELARESGLDTTLWTLLRLVELITDVQPPTSLMAALAPGRARRAFLRSLRLPIRMVERGDPHASASRFLARLLCAPSFGDRLRTITRFLGAREYHFLNVGYSPDELPGPLARGLFSLKRTVTLGKLGAFLVWRLVTQAASGDGKLVL